MEKLRRLVNDIVYAPDFSSLSLLQRSLLPLLSFSSSLYNLSLSVRYQLYRLGCFRRRRLPVAVISVGNLTWGGNGKTPMVAFLSSWFEHCGVSPLILSRGYGGGDEVKMLQRQFLGTSVKIGMGANRAKTAACILGRYGHVNHVLVNFVQKSWPDETLINDSNSRQVGIAILDDGMQHLSLSRDIEIVMVNGLNPWGNHHLIPLGPLREPLTALCRANAVVIHHADLVSEQILDSIESGIREIEDSLPIFFSRMAPSHFFTLVDTCGEILLTAARNRVLLCVSAIGSPNAFVRCIEKLGPAFVDRVDFTDHHSFELKDLDFIKERLEALQDRFGSKPAVVVTEKDYDRDHEVLLHLHPFEVLVLASRLQFVPYKGCSEESFKKLISNYWKVMEFTRETREAKLRLPQWKNSTPC